MLQIGNKPIDTMYVGGKLVQQAYLGVKKIYPEHGVIPKAIKDAMVLWYDLAKQGATNESMTTTPTLIDHSGNGHDATCYNFAWSGMSGVGGYDTWLFANEIEGTAQSIQLIDSYTIHITRLTDSNPIQSGCFWTIGKMSFRVILNVSGLQSNQTLFICQYNNNWYGKVELFEGRNDVTLDFEGTDVNGNLKYHYATFYTTTPGTFDVTIKLEPIYPNALVSDGVDDHCLVEGLPLLNKEDGFTVIAKRKWIEHTLGSGFASKRTRSGEVTGAFVYEINTTNGEQYVKSFDASFYTTIEANDIGYMTSVSYNGTPISKGNAEDTNKLAIFVANTSAFEYFGKNALYSLLLFNRDLSTDEIEWVKTNLIESEQ